MRLLFLTQYFPPEIGAPQNRLFDLAVELSEKNVDIVVLTAMPNYPRMKIYKGYRWRLFKREKVEGILIRRSFIFVRSSGSIFLRLLTYFSFVLSAFLAGFFLRGRFDFLFCESPPIFLGLTAFILKKIKHSKLIFNVSDLWPESAEKLGLIKNKKLLKLTGKLEEWIYRNSEIVTGQTQGIIRNIKERFPEKNVYWLKNGADLDYYDPEKVTDEWRNKMGFRGNDFILLYAGIFGYAQGIDTILAAANRLKEVGNIKFILMGDGPVKKYIEQEKLKQNLDHVYILPSVPKEEMPVILQSVNATIVPLKRIDLFKGAIPSKIFPSLAMGKPILLGVDGEAREIFIEKGKCGLFYEPENDNDLAEKINQLYSNDDLYDQFRKNARAFVDKYFNRKKIAADFYTYISEYERS